MYSIETFAKDEKNNAQTITTLEIAKMMDMEHSKLLRKLDGGSDRKGYVEILGEAHLGVTDYFIKSTYITDQNKEMPYYKVTKLGCDFLTNKFTGEKRIISQRCMSRNFWR